MITISSKHGIILERGGGCIVLDPTRKNVRGVVSHGHMDHLVAGALMTPETRDVLEARKGTRDAYTLAAGKRAVWHGFDVGFHSAGHVLGSIMVETEGVLYTGDFNPSGGFMSPPPPVPDVDVLITEATYAGSSFVFPPKMKVLEDIMAWAEAVSSEGPAIIGAYEFGKAQEIMDLGRRLGLELFVSEEVARLADVYNRFGAGLEYSVLGEDEGTSAGPGSMVVLSPSWLNRGKRVKQERYDRVQEMRRNGGRSAFVSGWCVVYRYFGSKIIDAQFPLSDHADHDQLLSFVSDAAPREVYITHSKKDAGERFARELESSTGCRAVML